MKKNKFLLSFLLLVLLFVAIMPAAYAEEQPADLDGAVEVLQADEGLRIKIKTTADYNIQAGDRISVIMLAADKQFETAKTRNVVYGDFCVVTDTMQECAFTHILAVDANAGTYQVKITWSRGDMKAEKPLSVSKIDAFELEAMIETFKTLTADAFDGSYEEYFNDKEYLDATNVKGLDNVSVSFGTSFVMARDALAAGGKIEADPFEISKASDIYKVLEAAVVLDALQYGDEAAVASALEEYEKTAPVLLGENLDKEDFVKVYEPKSAENFEKLDEAVKFSAAMALIKNGTLQDITNAINKFSEVLKIDINKIEEKGLSVSEVADKLNNTVPDSYNDGLEDEIDDIIAEITRTVARPSYSDGGGSSGGSGKKSGTSFALPVIKTTETPKEETKAEKPESFKDIESVLWAKDAIEGMQAKGILSGNGNGNFEPDRKVTREEFVKMMVVAFAIPVGKKEFPTFIDCKTENWYYPYVMNAYTSELVKGISDNMFGAGTEITRQDAAVICFRQLMAENVDIGRNTSEFTDNDKIADYAKTAVESLSGMNIINGYTDGSFMPDGAVTRAEAAVIIWRMLSMI